MAYTRINWKDLPSTATPRNATNLNVMDKGLFNQDARLTTAEGEIDTAQSDINGLDTRLTTAEGEIDNIQTGWVSSNETWTYSSVDNPTGVIKISGDKTTKYSLGMRIKFTNGGNTIYGIITKISYSSPNTSLSFLHEINPSTSKALHLIANSAITNNYYSNMKAPFGFPLNPSKWSIVFIDTTDREQSNPVNGTWYNLGSLSATIPMGLWKSSWKVALQANSSTPTGGRVIGTVSTSSTAETITEFTSIFNVTLAQVNIISSLFSQSELDLTAKTTFYFLAKTVFDASWVIFDNSESAMVFKTVCAYL